MHTGYYFIYTNDHSTNSTSSNFEYIRIKKMPFDAHVHTDFDKDSYDSIPDYPFYVTIDKDGVTFNFNGILEGGYSGNGSIPSSSSEIFRFDFQYSAEANKNVNKLLQYDIKEQINYDPNIYGENPDLEQYENSSSSKGLIQNPTYFNCFIFKDYFNNEGSNTFSKWLSSNYNRFVYLLSGEKQNNQAEPFEVPSLQRMLLEFLFDIDESPVFSNSAFYKEVFKLKGYPLFKAIWSKAKYYYKKNNILLLKQKLNASQSASTEKEVQLKIYRWINEEVDFIDALIDPKNLMPVRYAGNWFFDVESELKVLLFGDKSGLNAFSFSLEKSIKNFKKLFLVLILFSFVAFLIITNPPSSSFALLISILLLALSFVLARLLENEKSEFVNLHKSRDALQDYYRIVNQKPQTSNSSAPGNSNTAQLSRMQIEKLKEQEYRNHRVKVIGIESQRKINNFFLNRFSFLQAIRNVLPYNLRYLVFTCLSIVFVIGMIVQTWPLVYGETILSITPESTIFLAKFTSGLIFIPLLIYTISRFHYLEAKQKIRFSLYGCIFLSLTLLYFKLYHWIPLALVFFLYRNKKDHFSRFTVLNFILFILLLSVIFYNSSGYIQLMLAFALSLYYSILIHSKHDIHKHRLTFNIILPRMQMAIMSSWLIILSSEELIKSVMDIDEISTFIIFILTLTFAFSLLMFLNSIKLPDKDWLVFARRSFVILFIGYIFSLSFGLFAFSFIGHNMIINSGYLKKNTPHEMNKILELKEELKLENDRLRTQDQYFEKLLPFPTSYEDVDRDTVCAETKKYGEQIRNDIISLRKVGSDLLSEITNFDSKIENSSSILLQNELKSVDEICCHFHHNDSLLHSYILKIGTLIENCRIDDNKKNLKEGLRVDLIKTNAIQCNDALMRQTNDFITLYTKKENEILLSELKSHYREVDLCEVLGVENIYCSKMSNQVRYLHVYPKVLILFSVIGLFIGIFFQVIIQDRSVTDPFE